MVCVSLLLIRFLNRNKAATPRRKQGMKPIPSQCQAYKRLPSDSTKYFTVETIPKGLLSRHNTKKGVWGKLVVVKGELLYRQLEPEEKEFVLGEGVFGVIEPQLYHEVFPITDDVAFFIEFYQ